MFVCMICFALSSILSFVVYHLALEFCEDACCLDWSISFGFGYTNTLLNDGMYLHSYSRCYMSRGSGFGAENKSLKACIDFYIYFHVMFTCRFEDFGWVSTVVFLVLCWCCYQ